MFRNELVLVYKKAGSNDLYVVNFDGTQWYGGNAIRGQPGDITPVTDVAPSLIVFNDALYVVYKGAGSHSIYLAWIDGGTWSAPLAIDQMPGNINPQTDDTPRPAVYNGSLYIIYKQPNSTELYCIWYDGTRWYGGATINDPAAKFDPKSKYNPAAIDFDGKLYILYRGESLNTLYTAWFGGTAWAGNIPIGKQPPGNVDPASQFTPGVLVYESKLCLVYTFGNSVMLYSASFDGDTWTGDQPILVDGVHPQSNYNPELALMPFVPANQPNWMASLRDDSVISGINLPGTHDSAAIRTAAAAMTTPQGLALARHYTSITSQLMSGVRLLDIRLKVDKQNVPDEPAYTFITCHDDIDIGLGINEFQSFFSVLQECVGFLTKFPKEFIAMSLKIDDWNGNDSSASQKQQVATALYESLVPANSGWKIEMFYPTSVNMPTLKAVRGKLFLLNRVDSGTALGIPLLSSLWINNTEFSQLILKTDGSWDFNAYVQDKWDWSIIKNEAAEEKMPAFWNAPGKTQSGDLLLNFGSAMSGDVWVVDVKPLWLDELGTFDNTTKPPRPTRLGWSLFDFENSAYPSDPYGMLTVVQMIVASNFGYAGYPRQFNVTG